MLQMYLTVWVGLYTPGLTLCLGWGHNLWLQGFSSSDLVKGAHPELVIHAFLQTLGFVFLAEFIQGVQVLPIRIVLGDLDFVSGYRISSVIPGLFPAQSDWIGSQVPHGQGSNRLLRGSWEKRKLVLAKIVYQTITGKCCYYQIILTIISYISVILHLIYCLQIKIFKKNYE